MAHRHPLLRFSAAAFIISGTISPAAADDNRDSIEDRARGVRWASFALQEECPDDLIVELAAESGNRQFAEFVYGTPESRRVAVVLVPGEHGEFELYVDRDRDRVVRARDRVEGAGQLRLLPLDAEQIVDDVSLKFPRELLIQNRPGRNQIRIATATTIEHSIRPDDDEDQSELLIQQADGNANGLYSDPRDQLLVDLNGDGRFDPFLEVFPFRPLLAVGGHRWFVRGDRFGRRLKFETASATGRLQLAVALADHTARIEELVFTVAGEDGSVFSLTGADEAVDLPAGRYSASVLFASIRSAGDDRTRSFTFSRSGGTRAEEWIEIAENETTTLDPIGTLKLDAVTESRTSGNEQVLEIQPRLFTETGLLINSCLLSDASPYSGPQCHATLLDSGRSIGAASSGFA